MGTTANPAPTSQSAPSGVNGHRCEPPSLTRQPTWSTLLPQPVTTKQSACLCGKRSGQRLAASSCMAVGRQEP